MAIKTIIRQSISDQMLKLIKASIFSLDFPPGTRLIVDAIAEQFNSSRTPVREALKKLVEQGLIEYNGIGYRVISLSPEDINEIYSLRAPLEMLAVQQATERITPTELIELQQNTIDFLQCEPALESIFLDIDFHLLIAKASHNKRLESILLSLMDQHLLINRWLYNHKPATDMKKTTIEEHLKILKMIKAGNIQGAVVAMEQHLKAAEVRAIL